MNAYEQGRLDTLRSLGIVKEASLWGGGVRLAKHYWPGVSRFGKNFATNFKNILIGSPFKAIDEIQAGKALAKGGLIRGGFSPGKGLPGALFGGLMYGLPAYEGYQILKGNAPDKAEQLGKLIGGTAAGLGTWKAFGLLGSMAAAPLGSTLGGLIGKSISPSKPLAQQNTLNQYSVSRNLPTSSATLAAGRHLLNNYAWGPRRLI